MYSRYRSDYKKYLTNERKLAEKSIDAYMKDIDLFVQWLDSEGLKLNEIDGTIARTYLFHLNQENYQKVQYRGKFQVYVCFTHF